MKDAFRLPGLAGLAGLAVLLLALPPALPAQAGEGTGPLLGPDHWAVRAAARAHGMGLAPAFQPAQAAVPVGEVAAALLTARARSDGEPGGVERLVEGWIRRFEADLGASPETVAGQARWAAGRVGVGARVRRGAAAPGRGVFDEVDRTGAQLLPDRAGPEAAVGGSARPLPGLAVRLEGRIEPADAALGGWEVAGRAGPVRASLGRTPLGYGSGGIVIAGAVPVTRLEVASARPLRLPGAAAGVGPLTFHTFLAPLREARHSGDPFLWGASLTLRPHPRLTLAAHRGAMLGGSEVEEAPLTVGNVLLTILGRHVGDLANQVASLEVRWRLPTPAHAPATLYLEGGAEDSAGAWANVPGLAFGLLLPALPGAPGASVGVEHAYFGPECCGNPPWYRHRRFTGSWALADRPLGHRLGGDGAETRVYGELDAGGAVRVRGAAFARERREDNVFVPGREGWSAGGEVGLSWRPGPRLEVVAGLASEAGRGWTTARGRGGLSWGF